MSDGNIRKLWYQSDEIEEVFSKFVDNTEEVIMDKSVCCQAYDRDSDINNDEELL